jgi:hypothetical protein
MSCYGPPWREALASPFAGLLPSESQLVGEIAAGDDRVGFVTSTLSGVTVTTDMLPWCTYSMARSSPRWIWDPKSRSRGH